MNEKHAAAPFTILKGLKRPTASAPCAALLLALAFSGCGGTTDTKVTSATSESTPAVAGNAGGEAPASNASAPAVSGGATPIPPPKEAGSPGVRKVKDPAPQIGSGAADFSLFTKVRAAIISDEELRDTPVIVDAREGVVTLSGSVGSDEQRARAVQIAQGVPGVRSVKNQMTTSAKGVKP